MTNPSCYRKTTCLSVLVLLFVISVPPSCWTQGKIKGYDKASYNVSQSGEFMHAWLLAGPFSVSSEVNRPDNAVQESAFKSDATTSVDIRAGKRLAPLTIGQKEIDWKFISASEDIIDLDKFYKAKDFAYAYAMAEIKADAPTNVIMGIGSDDGVKVWHNGKLVHENWVPRASSKDNDIVPLKLVKGSNQILLKIQDMEGGWSFVARLLDKTALAEQLNAAAAAGNLEMIQMLVEHGADVNAISQDGMSPVAAAKIAGRNEIVQTLVKNGAKDVAVPTGELITDNFYNSLKGKDYPGIAVLVAKDGDVVYKKGFGYAVIKNKIPVTPDTKFRIGSVTKQFTAAAILKLQEAGLLNVNDKVSKFIPGFPRGDEVTIHHLLTHSSGIHSYTGRPDFLGRVTEPIVPDSLISLIEKDPYDFNPGENFMYNNSGYFMLGYIIGKVSGKPYDVYLKETFFDPLGMTNTGVHHSGIKLDHEAMGYSRSGSGYGDALDWDMSWAGGAGAMYSTVDDLLKWNQALYGGKVINEKSFQSAITPVVLKNGKEPQMNYGYGLVMGKYRGMDNISHSGGLNGFLTQLAYYPKEKMTVVMFTNTNQPEVNFNPNKIAEAFIWDKMEAQRSFVTSSVNPKELQSYAGRYEFPNVGVLTVTTADDKLFAQLSGQPKFEIFPSAADEFFWKVVDARLKFTRDEKGQVNGTVLYQNGQELKATRLGDEKIVTIDPAVFDNYTGKYRLNSNIVVTIFKENNKLFALPTDQARLELLPKSETDFVILEINAKLSFVKDATGKATMIKLNMNGANTDMPRIE